MNRKLSQHAVRLFLSLSQPLPPWKNNPPKQTKKQNHMKLTKLKDGTWLDMLTVTALSPYPECESFVGGAQR